MIDYDLVIIGGNLAAISAAIQAHHLQARVALIINNDDWLDNYYGLNFYVKTLGQISLFPLQYSSLLKETDRAYLVNLVNNLSTHNSFNILAEMGIDVIYGQGEFVPKPQLAFVVNDRKLRSRSYLLTSIAKPAIPAIGGLENSGYFTLSELCQKIQAQQTIPDQLVFIGGEPLGVELAQALARLGKQVTIIVKGAHIFNKEDADASFLVQAKLEAEGIRILTQTAITQIKLIDEKKWLQAGDQAIEAEAIILATGQTMKADSLNLASVGVKYNQKRVYLNDRLQTTNPKIYGCGEVAGGYPFPHIAIYEAEIAVKNIIFAPIFTPNYKGIPWAIFTEPQLARIGLTEHQARQKYQNNIYVQQTYFNTVDRAIMSEKTSGYCQLIGRPNGEILGACIVGEQASELIHSIAIAMRTRLKIPDLATQPYIWPTFNSLIGQTAQEWQWQRFHHQSTWPNWLEKIAHWRRYWSN